MLNLPAGTRFADPLAELRRRFHDWHDPIPALLDATRTDAMLVARQFPEIGRLAFTYCYFTPASIV